MRDYSDEIDSYWPTIERAWTAHSDKHPVIECDLAKGQVVAYPAREYIAGLSDRNSSGNTTILRSCGPRRFDHAIHSGQR